MTTRSRARHAALTRWYGPINIDPHYRVPRHTPPEYRTLQRVWWQESPGVLMKVTIIQHGGWHGDTPFYTVVLPGPRGTLKHHIDEAALANTHDGFQRRNSIEVLKAA